MPKSHFFRWGVSSGVRRLGLGLAIGFLAVSTPSYAGELVAAPPGDPHYTEAGFFDLHVCNWPNRPLFFLGLVSTYRFAEVQGVDIFDPQGRPVGTLGTERYRVIEQKGKPEKRVFMKHLDIPEGSGNGWYSAHIRLKNGEKYEAKDYVILHSMDRASGMVPADGAQDVPLPKELRWKPIPGARYYQVFVKDLWNGEKLVMEPKLVSEPRLALPEGVIQPGGYYSWRIHARDTNGNVLLGDFNHGSLNREAKFTVAFDE